MPAYGAGSRGVESGGYGAAGGYASGQQGYPQQGYGGGDQYKGEQEKKKSNSNMMLGVAGGVAVGAVGGVLIADALGESTPPSHLRVAAPFENHANQSIDDSDDERRGGGGAPTVPPPMGGGSDMPPAVLPPTDADGDSVSGSDRESVQEARDDYEDALAKANDSDASSSDREEAEEAREEYVEEYEENYED